MANAKGSSIVRNMIYNGKHSLLPPKSPFPSISPAYVDYVPSSAIGPRGTAMPREGNSNHQRTSSESFLMEDQPSWLDELLNEPDTPVRRGGHRRSSSDSFAYIDTANVVNIDCIAQEEYRNKNINSVPAWGLQDFGANQKVRAWDSSLNAIAQSIRNNVTPPISVSSYTSQEADGIPCTATEKQESVESITHDPRAAERKDSSYAKSFASETDTKRAKQQFAQRSRVRKLQYIAELERNVQALQVEGSEVSAELEFLNQQNLILSMENKALKQRLENLAQEQLIKYMEHEVLEREIGRLRALYQQQQHQPQQQLSSSHRRSRSRDLDSQLANLSLKHKEPSSGRDSVHGSLHT